MKPVQIAIVFVLMMFSAYTGYLKGTVDAIWDDKTVMMVKPLEMK